MAKTLLILGLFLVIHTIIAKLIGFSVLTDYLPVDWSLNIGGDYQYFKVVATNKPSYDWLYLIVLGMALIAFGYFFIRRKKYQSNHQKIK